MHERIEYIPTDWVAPVFLFVTDSVLAPYRCIPIHPRPPLPSPPGTRATGNRFVMVSPIDSNSIPSVRQPLLGPSDINVHRTSHAFAAPSGANDAPPDSNSRSGGGIFDSLTDIESPRFAERSPSGDYRAYGDSHIQGPRVISRRNRRMSKQDMLEQSEGEGGGAAAQGLQSDMQTVLNTVRGEGVRGYCTVLCPVIRGS